MCVYARVHTCARALVVTDVALMVSHLRTPMQVTGSLSDPFSAIMQHICQTCFYGPMCRCYRSLHC